MMTFEGKRFFKYNFSFRNTFVLREPGESPNDRNDRAIRVAAKWYQDHLGSAVSVLLITNNRENKK